MVKLADKLANRLGDHPAGQHLKGKRWTEILSTALLALVALGLVAVWAAATEGYETTNTFSPDWNMTDKDHWFSKFIPGRTGNLCQPAFINTGSSFYTTNGVYLWEMGKGFNMTGKTALGIDDERLNFNSTPTQYEDNVLTACDVAGFDVDMDLLQATVRVRTYATCVDPKWPALLHTENLYSVSRARILDSSMFYQNGAIIKESVNDTDLNAPINEMAGDMWRRMRSIYLQSGNVEATVRAFTVKNEHNCALNIQDPRACFDQVPAWSVTDQFYLYPDMTTTNQPLSTKLQLEWNVTTSNFIQMLFAAARYDFSSNTTSNMYQNPELRKTLLTTTETNLNETAQSNPDAAFNQLTGAQAFIDGPTYPEPKVGRVRTSYMCLKSAMKPPAAFAISVIGLTLALFGALFAVLMLVAKKVFGRKIGNTTVIGGTVVAPVIVAGGAGNGTGSGGDCGECGSVVGSDGGKGYYDEKNAPISTSTSGDMLTMRGYPSEKHMSTSNSGDVLYGGYPTSHPLSKADGMHTPIPFGHGRGDSDSSTGMGLPTTPGAPVGWANTPTPTRIHAPVATAAGAGAGMVGAGLAALGFARATSPGPPVGPTSPVSPTFARATSPGPPVGATGVARPTSPGAPVGATSPVQPSFGSLPFMQPNSGAAPAGAGSNVFAGNQQFMQPNAGQGVAAGTAALGAGAGAAVAGNQAAPRAPRPSDAGSHGSGSAHQCGHRRSESGGTHFVPPVAMPAFARTDTGGITTVPATYASHLPEGLRDHLAVGQQSNALADTALAQSEKTGFHNYMPQGVAQGMPELTAVRSAQSAEQTAAVGGIGGLPAGWQNQLPAGLQNQLPAGMQGGLGKFGLGGGSGAAGEAGADGSPAGKAKGMLSSLGNLAKDKIRGHVGGATQHSNV